MVKQVKKSIVCYLSIAGVKKKIVIKAGNGDNVY
jgi:hypothetical protein